MTAPTSSPPIVSVITSISKDHTQLLGDTLEAIAREKAGIIKPHTPVIIGRGESPEVREVFVKKAAEEEAPIIFAEEAVHIKAQTPRVPWPELYTRGKGSSPYYFGLGGLVQRDNFRAIYATIQELRSQGIAISEETFRDGLRVCRFAYWAARTLGSTISAPRTHLRHGTQRRWRPLYRRATP